MRVAGLIAKIRLPRSLAARAVLFTVTVLSATALLSAATMLIGAQRESRHHQLEVAHDLTAHYAVTAGNMLASGRTRPLIAMTENAVTRDDVLGAMVVDAEGAAIAHSGGAEARALMRQVAAAVARDGEMKYLRGRGGDIAVGARVLRNGEAAGTAVLMWRRGAYRFDPLAALTPFMLFVGCLLIAIIPLTALIVRRTMAPLDTLARFAEGVGKGDEGKTLNLRTGDEFEVLANAFNRMIARLDSSMRRIQEVSFVDPVTQLPNQERFVRELKLLIHQPGDEQAAIAVFELKGLPRILQTLEPGTARDLLRVVAERFSNALRSAAGGRAAVAARLSATEFAALAPGYASPAEAARFAQSLNENLNRPFEWRGHRLAPAAACGVVVAPRDATDAEMALRRARMALQAAQIAPTQVKVFTPALDREAVARLALERDMRAALERNEFRAYFQPKIDMASGRIGACEALARWVRPDSTIVSPARFIPVAEESGLIEQLSEAIMREACWKGAAWARAGAPVKIAVNVSALEFRSDRFAENVLRVLQSSGLPPHLLELEITESMAMEDIDRALRQIEPLRAIGVRLAIDDFGCGHSSLAALSKLPFDVIKIDRQFVRALEIGDPQAPAIVDMIIALARTLNLEIVAEGIERREEAEFLAGRGCQWAQGFLYGAAAPAAEFADKLRRQNPVGGARPIAAA